MAEQNFSYEPSFLYKLIYVFQINDESHKGLVKIGEASIHTNKDYTAFQPNCTELNKAAKERISDYTKTASIDYQLLYTEIAVRKTKKGKIVGFRDFTVRDVLIRSGFKKHKFPYENQGTEWFEVSLNQVIDAIKAVKEGRKSLNSFELMDDFTPIVFRDEQEDAIKQTIKTFKTSDRILWNAKMRFGKTLCALEVAKREGYKTTLIMTHRPVVEDNWFDDFIKIFTNTDYDYGSKVRGESIEDLKKNNRPFVYFASLQDLRGSQIVGGDFDKNEEIFSVDWDMVVIDEAHEGTQTELGQKTIDTIVNKDNGKHTKVISLSGTPFNLVSDYAEGEIYTWDYIREQKAKRDWPINHFGDSNPYEELPSLEMFVYDLDKSFPGYIEIADDAFNFREFFRTWTGNPLKDKRPLPANAKIGDFIHKNDVWAFLNLLSDKNRKNGFPFSKKEYIDYFKHTLWVLPGVKEAKALSAMLSEHPVFGSKTFFTIVNVAGDGDVEKPFNDALQLVRDAIGDNPDDHCTITLTCSSGRLTTGVTIPEWTAVFMLAGSCNTSPSSYLQTIFRIQNPANINGKMKEKCYVFDFAPDRTLKMVAEAANLSTKVGNVSNDMVVMNEFLNFCPVISLDASEMVHYDASLMMQELNKAYAERVVKNGFDDKHIYNDNLLRLDNLAWEDFNDLKRIIGTTKASAKTKDVEITATGFTDEEYDYLVKAEKKPKKERTPEEIAQLEKLKEERKKAQNAMSILRGISIRIPLLIYGADIPYEEEITIDNFAELVDDASWEEFMPEGVTKQTFKKFSKYYEQNVFIAAGKKIRQLARAADDENPTERAKQIGELFMTFRNPDKETILTPWWVVNMHLSDCIGGYKFFGEDNRTPLEKPLYISQGSVTNDLFIKDDVKILEINSKTGLYPLYVVYSIYQNRVNKLDIDENNLEELYKVWVDVVQNNIYIICKTNMAKTITKRTLLGYRNETINAHAFDDLVMQMRNKPDQLSKRISKGSFWKKEDIEMKFDAVVGNPPYQLMGGAGGSNDSQIYQYFSEFSNKITDHYSCLITKAAWFTSGRDNELGQYRSNMLKSHKIKKLVVYNDASEVFERAEIKGGVCYHLYDKGWNGLCECVVHTESGSVETTYRDLSELELFIRDKHLLSVVKKIIETNTEELWMEDLVSSDTPFGLPSNPETSKKKSFKLYDTETEEHNIKVYYNQGNIRMPIKYISEKDITKNRQDIHFYKVFVPENGGSGTDRYILGLPIYGEKNSVCSQTYLYIPFSTGVETKNCIKYIKTKFFRALVASIKVTQSAPNRFYRFVPLQDFTDTSDIDWSKSLIEIDEQLFEKYNLDEEQKEYIRSLIDYMKE